MGEIGGRRSASDDAVQCSAVEEDQMWYDILYPPFTVIPFSIVTVIPLFPGIMASPFFLFSFLHAVSLADFYMVAAHSIRCCPLPSPRPRRSRCRPRRRTRRTVAHFTVTERDPVAAPVLQQSPSDAQWQQQRVWRSPGLLSYPSQLLLILRSTHLKPVNL